jgi:hypothetical protein
MFGLTDTLNNTYYFPVPEYGYKSVIELPWDIDVLDTGSHVVFDHGITYDKYRCDFDLLLTPAQQTNLNTLVKHSGRAVNTLVFTMNAACGFFPFTPLRGDGGPFTVALMITKSEIFQEEPFLYFRVSCSMRSMGAWPAYSLPAQIIEGNMYICGTFQVRFPQDWFDPEEDNGISNDVTENGNLNFIDRGLSAASWRTKMKFKWGTGTTAALLNNLLPSTRATWFNLGTTANYYAFGNDRGSSGSYAVTLIQDSLEFVHDGFNQFSFDLYVEYISG